MIPRLATEAARRLASHYPVVVITGPRQSGKTTLVRTTFATKPYVNLEAPDLRSLASSDPRGFLSSYPEGAIIDEAQRVPELFSYLQVAVDEQRTPGRYILTGSQHFNVLAGVTQSLSGRAGLLHLLPLSCAEVDTVTAAESLETRMLRGFYPALLEHGIPANLWYADYVSTYLERDIGDLISVRDMNTFRKFMRMCATRTAQVLNVSALATDCGVAQNTARAWLSILEASYVVHLLQPYSVNFGKRLTKAPKLYFYDCGLAAWLAGVRDVSVLEIGSMRGQLFETMVVGEFLKQRCNTLSPSEIFFWRDSHGLEADIVVQSAAALHAVEVKAGTTVAGDWFTPMEKFALLAATASNSLVYGGDLGAKRKEVGVVSWRRLPTLVTRTIAPLT